MKRPPRSHWSWTTSTRTGQGRCTRRSRRREAKALWDRFEFVYTPKHGSWLNMAEIELNVLAGQCLKERIDNRDELASKVAHWQAHRNNRNSTDQLAVYDRKGAHKTTPPISDDRDVT